MIKGGAVEIEGGKLTFEEQLALGEAAEKARLEAEEIAKAEALAEWEAYKAEQLTIASAKASALTASTAPVILSKVNLAKTKEAWLKAEVSNSKKRAEDNIKKLAETIDPDERASIEEAIISELDTLDGWVNVRPRDPILAKERLAGFRKAIKGA
jgi:predicted PP-loop superfamily ATPase